MGIAILGSAGKDIFEYAGVMGDFKEDWEEMELCSAMEDEFLRVSELIEPLFLPFLVKSPISDSGSCRVSFDFAEVGEGWEGVGGAREGEMCKRTVKTLSYPAAIRYWYVWMQCMDV